jgi:hypothetical protein
LSDATDLVIFEGNTFLVTIHEKKSRI